MNYLQDHYYRVQFANWNDTVVYQFANNAVEAIEQARRQNPTILTNAAARKVVLSEWKHQTNQYTIGGGFTK